MKVIHTIKELKEYVHQCKKDGKSIGLVTTMGALHEGHASLIAAARKENDFVITSVFVNPTQFGPNEDYDKYPRQLEADVAKCEEHAADVVFAPSPSDIYAPDASTTRAQLWTILARQNDADLTGGSIWYEKAQNWAKDKGVSDGANPNAAINRAQMVTMLWRTMGQPTAGGTANFTDVPTDSYYAQAVAWAVENGITTGVGGGRFDPTATCTRGQIATFLYRLYLSR